MATFETKRDCMQYVVGCIAYDVLRDFDIAGMVDSLFYYDECEQAYVLRDDVDFWDVAQAHDVSERG